MDMLPFIRTDRVKNKIIVLLDDIRDRGLYQQQSEIRGRSEQRRLLIRKLNSKGPDAFVVEGDIGLFLPIGSVADANSEQYNTGRVVPLLEGPRQ